MRLLKFEASWCQPCKMLSKVMEEVDFPYPVEAIDVDQRREVALEYGVRGVPLLILLDENNNIITRMSGVQTKEQLEEALQLNGKA